MRPLPKTALLAAALALPLALVAAGGAPSPSRLVAAALNSPNGSIAQRQAIERARQAEAHPIWKTLTASGRVERLAFLARRMLTRALAAGDAAPPPSASFQGNLTLMRGPSGQAIELQRQPDCSLSFSVGSYTMSLTNPTIQVLTTTPQYQNVLHDAAGLTTTAGTYPRGCADATLGIGSRRGFYLGRTSQNLYMFASSGYNYAADSNALYYGTVDAATQTVHAFATELSLPDIDGIAAADLNGDGLADVVGLDMMAGRVAVWLAHADGTLSAPTMVTTAGSRTRAAVLADVDGDGKVDLVAATTSISGSTTVEAIVVLRGHGDGSFGAPEVLNVTTPTGGFTAQVVNLVAVDLRGTGRPDIVGSNGLVLLNDGSGHYTQAAFGFSPPNATTSWGPTLARGDFNEDGRQDVAVNDGSSTTIYLGRGDGTFARGMGYASSDSVGYITATDLDGDGHTDLYIGLANGGFFGGDQFGVNQGYALLGRGDGTFSGAPSLPFVYNGHNLVDLNGDGKLDGIGVGSDLSLTSWLGDGHGGYTAGSTLATSPLAIGGQSYFLRDIQSYDVADIDGDGRPDVVFLSTDFAARNSPSDYYTPGLLIARGDGQGGLAAPTFLPAPSFVPAGDIDINLKLSNVRLADVDGDGRPDLIYAYATTSYATNVRSIGTAVQLGNGDGTFQAPRVLPFYSRPDTSGTYDLASQVQQIVDLNGDGKPDLVLITQSATINSTLGGQVSTVQVALGRGDGTFATPVDVAGPELMTRYSAQPDAAAIVVADVNGDGIPDLAMLGSSSGYALQVAIAPGRGDGTFAAPSRTTFAAQALIFQQQIAVADFNGDGKPDVLVANPFGATGIAYGNGDGTLSPLGTAGAATFNQVVNIPIGGTARALELNGDGKPDVIVGNTLLLSTAASATTPGTPTGSGGGSGGTPGGSSGFSLGATTVAGSVRAGQSVQTTISLAPDSGYTGSVNFSCAGLPAGASCSFDPPAVTVVGGAATSTTMTIGTTASAGAGVLAGFDPRTPGGATFVALAMLGGFAIVARRRRGTSPVPLAAFAALKRAGAIATLAAGGLMLASCGGSSSDDAGGAAPAATPTPAGSYTIVVTATDGTVSRSVNYTLQVE